MQRPDLVYYPDDQPGIRRKRRGRGFTYFAPDGTRIAAAEERARIEALAVPPAYENVWICPLPNGHLQATGRDDRLRKQYRYHPDWTAYRAWVKYAHLADFGRALPALRRRILRDLKSEPGSASFAVAAVLALLDRLAMRMGDPGYSRENKTYGATTLKSGHLSFTDGEIRLDYPGKGGRRVHKALRDRTLNKTLHQLDDLPGAQLVGWVDDQGTPHGVSSEQVNGFLADFIGCDEISAKTFRTWNGSVAALEAALETERPKVKTLAEAAAARLHNTPTIARSSYIHPDVIALAEADADRRHEIAAAAPHVEGLRRAEAQLLHLLA